MADQNEIVIEDSFIIAVLTLPPFNETLTITPFKQSSTKIAWQVKGDVMPVLQRIYQNEKIGISDYIRALKTIRNSIFLFKSINDGACGDRSSESKPTVVGNNCKTKENKL